MSTLRLSKKQKEMAQEILDNHRGHDDLWEYVAWNRTSEGLIDPEELLQNLRARGKYSDEECRALVEISLLRLHLLPRGVARRLLLEQMVDLRQALALEARIEWVERGGFGNDVGGGNCSMEALYILKALAARDLAVVTRFFEVSGDLVRKPRKDLVPLYDALFAITIGDEEIKGEARAALATAGGAAAWQAIYATLAAIMHRDASAVALALNETLATFRRLPEFLLHGDEKIISFIGHGLAQLAMEQDADLLSEFDTTQGLPWDSAFFELTQSISPSFELPGLYERSELAHRLINELETPGWWAER